MKVYVKRVSKCLKKLSAWTLAVVGCLLFLLTACDGNDTKFRAEIVSEESAFYAEDGTEIDSNEYARTPNVTKLYLSIAGFAKNKKELYDEIATLEVFSKKAILVGTYGGIQSELEIRLNGQLMDHWCWFEDINISPSIGDHPFACRISLDKGPNEITLIAVGKNGSYVKKTLRITPVDTDF